MKPIKPEEIINSLDSILPDSVVQAVNNLLKEKYRGGTVAITQKEIVSEIIRIDPNLTRKQIFDKNMLDFEPIFRKMGWIVKYDSPGWNETYYEEFFEFTSKKNKRG